MGNWYPCFGLLVTSVLDFKAREDLSHAYFVACIHAMHSSGSPLCDTCWPLDGQPSIRVFLIHILFQACIGGTQTWGSGVLDSVRSNYPSHFGMTVLFLLWHGMVWRTQKMIQNLWRVGGLISVESTSPTFSCGPFLLNPLLDPLGNIISFSELEHFFIFLILCVFLCSVVMYKESDESES